MSFTWGDTVRVRSQAPRPSAERPRQQRFLILGTVVALYAVSLASMSSGVPRLTSPFPLLVVAPAFVLGAVLPPRLAVVVAAFVTPILFLVWTRGGRLGSSIPARSKYGFLILIALGMWAVVAGIPYGRKYQGAEYVIGVVTLNVAFWGAMLATYVRNRGRPSYASNLFWHTLAFAWLGFVAVPYMGELP